MAQVPVAPLRKSNSFGRTANELMVKEDRDAPDDRCGAHQSFVPSTFICGGAMSLRVERNQQDERLCARLHAAGLHLTENRRTVLSVFFAGTEPVTITDLWLRTKKWEQ
jgi:hypothetical protein